MKHIGPSRATWDTRGRSALKLFRSFPGKPGKVQGGEKFFRRPSNSRRVRVVRLSFFRDHDFEVLARHHQRVWTADVQAFEKGGEVGGQAGLAVAVERRERFVHRPIKIAEHLDPVRGRPIAKVEVSPHAANVARFRAEQLGDARLGPP